MISPLCISSGERSELIYRATARESERSRWADCFAELLQSGLLTLPACPGSEFGLSVGGYPPTDDNGVARLCRQVLFPALREGCSVSLDMGESSNSARSELCRESCAERLSVWQRHLHAGPANESLVSGSLGISLTHEQLLGGEKTLRLAKSLLRGSARVAVRYRLSTTDIDPRDWSELVYRSHGDTLIQPVPASAVRPLSALHSSEKGQVVMPHSLFDVRSLSAWLTIDLDVRLLREPLSLRRRLASSLRFADNLIDVIDWPLPALRLDALLNRRVAVRLSHIGNVLLDSGVRPNHPDAFRRLQRWLHFIRACFVHESMLLARRRGPFPELGAGELVASLTPRYGVADANRLVRNRMLRHRHLLALSPLSLFPDVACSGSAAAWIGLIPAISCADAVAMHGPEMRTRLQLADWGRLLQLTAAVASAAVAGKRTGYYVTA
jgi:hypothetical protein